MMRAVLAFLLLGAGLWQAFSDWRATIGQGYAYRLTPGGQLWADAAPRSYEKMVGALKASAIPYVWDPVGATLLALPMALTLIGLAGLIWLSRGWR